MRWRPGYAAVTAVLLLTEIAIALWVRDAAVRPYGGDVLAVVLVHTGLRAVIGWRWPTVLGIALGIAVAIESAQAAGLPTLLGLERSSAAGVVLGASFAWLDLLAYAIGGAAVAVVETWRRPPD